MSIDYSIQYKHWHTDDPESKTRDMDYWKYFLDLHKVLPENRNAKILELGCAMGRLLLTLQELGYHNILGVEQDAKLSEKAQAEGLSVVQDDALNFLVNTKDTFDVVFLLDVLEHIKKADEIPLLEKIYEKLSQTGFLVVQVPNAASPVSNIMLYDDPTHHRLYGEKSLYFCLHHAKFKQINIREQAPPHNDTVAMLRAIYNNLYHYELDQQVILSLNLVAVAYKEQRERNIILPRFFPNGFAENRKICLVGNFFLYGQWQPRKRDAKPQAEKPGKKNDDSRPTVKQMFPWIEGADRTTLDPMQNLFIDVLPWLRKLPEDFDSILDIGCGTGYMSTFFHARGHTVTACDPWDRFLFKNTIEYHQSTADVLKGRQFDALILSHVIEHIPNPLSFIQKISPLLKDDGYLFIMVPMSLRVENGHWWQGWSLPQLGVFLTCFGFDCQCGIFEKCGYSACGFGKKTERPIDESFTIAGALKYLPSTFQELAIDEGWGYSLYTNATYIDADRIIKTPYPYAELTDYEWKISCLMDELKARSCVSTETQKFEEANVEEWKRRAIALTHSRWRKLGIKLGIVKKCGWMNE